MPPRLHIKVLMDDFRGALITKKHCRYGRLLGVLVSSFDGGECYKMSPKQSTSSCSAECPGGQPTSPALTGQPSAPKGVLENGYEKYFSTGLQASEETVVGLEG